MPFLAKKELRSACCLAAGGVVYAFFAVRCGASLPFLLWAFLFLWLTMWLPGRTAAVLLAGSEAGAGLAFTLGLALFSLVTVLCSLRGSGLPFWVWLCGSLPFTLPTCLAAPYRSLPGPLRRFCQTLHSRGQGAFFAQPGPAPAAAALLALLGLAAGRAAHPLAVGTTIPQQDLYWNAGNAASFAFGFPPQDLRYSGYTLTYHYLTELLAGGLSMGCGISCYDAVAFVLPPALLLGALAALAELGGLLWPTGAGGRPDRRAVLLPWAVLLLGDAGGLSLLKGYSSFGNLFAIHLLTNINAVATAALLTVALLSLLLRVPALPGGLRSPRSFLPPVLCFALLCVAKGPVAALAALALLCAVLLLLPRLPGRDRLPALLLAAALLAVFALFYRILFAAGVGSSVEFSTHATLEKGAFAPVLAALKARSGLLYTAALPVFMVLQSLCMAPFAFPLFCFGAVRTLRARRRWNGRSMALLFCYALGFGGLLAFFLFDHPSMSQSYFACAALLAVDVAALDQLPALTEKGKPLRLAAGALAALSLFTGICSCMYLARSGALALFSPEAAVAEKPRYTPLTADEEAALLWLGRHMPPTGYFATNRMHTGAAEEGLSNVYSAISGRRAYMESFKYAMTNMGAPPEEVGARYEQMSALFAFDGVADPERAVQLCRETNVSWLVYNKTLQGSDAAFADAPFEKQYENDTVVIYSLNLN